jgi:hypothetical protein
MSKLGRAFRLRRPRGFEGSNLLPLRPRRRRGTFRMLLSANNKPRVGRRLGRVVGWFSRRRPSPESGLRAEHPRPDRRRV